MYASANYLGQDGYIKLNPETNQRIATNLKVTSRLNDRISINYGMRFNQIDFENRPSLLIICFPIYPDKVGLPYRLRSEWIFVFKSDLGFASTGWRPTQEKTNETTQQLNIVVEPIKGWKVIGDVNYQIYQERVHEDIQKMYNHDVNGNPYQYTGFSSNSSVSEEYKGTKYLNVNAYTEYVKELGGHNFKIMGGFQSEQFWQDKINARRLGIIVDGMDALNATSGTDGSGK